MKRPLIHFHMAKTGGQSFNRVLGTVFKKESIHAVNHNYGHFKWGNKSLDIKNFKCKQDTLKGIMAINRKARENYTVLQGHECWYGIHLYFGLKNPLYVLIMRDPKRRYLSYYNHVTKSPDKPFTWHDYVEKVHNITINDICNRYFGRELKLNNIDPVLYDLPMYAEYLLADPRLPKSLDMAQQILEHHTDYIMHLETIDEDFRFLVCDYYETDITEKFPHHNKKVYKFKDKEEDPRLECAVALDQKLYDWSFDLKERQKAKLMEEKENEA